MSLIRNLKTQESTSRSLHLAIATVSLLILPGIAAGTYLWRALRERPPDQFGLPIPYTSLTVAPVLISSTAPWPGASSLRSETTCWIADVAFVQRQDDLCENSARKQVRCDWRFTSRDGGEATLDDWLQRGQDPVLLFVYGGHDTLRIATSSRWDSNIQIASSRANQVIKGLTGRFQRDGVRRALSPIPVPDSLPPATCGQDASGDFDRRRPTVVTVEFRLTQETIQ